MGYTRDTDRATRGPGAIAALDRVGGRRYQQQQAGARATRTRDAKMVAIARGALGIIDTRSLERSGAFAVTKPALPVVRPPIVSPSPPLVKVAPTAAQLNPVVANTTPGPLAVAIPSPVAPPLPASPLPPALPEVGRVRPPALPVITPSPVSTAPPKTSGSGGMSTGASSIMTTGGIKPVMLPATTNVVPADVAASGVGSMRVLLPVLGGAAIALYFMLRKR